MPELKFGELITPTLLTEVVNTAVEAGQKIMEIYRSEFDVQLKQDQSPVTEADLRANDWILSRLKQLTPKIPILSEEALEAFDAPNAAGQYWLIDPLDGTKEFVNRADQFTVNIALIERGETVFGVVYAPALDQLYYGIRGRGAYKQATDRGSLIAPAASISVSCLSENPLRVLGSRSHQNQETLDWLKHLDNYQLRGVGSSLKFCLIAEGKGDLYPRLGPTSLWDTAAGQAVLEAAGGRVVQLNGEVLSYASPDQRLNPHFIAYGLLPVGLQL